MRVIVPLLRVFFPCLPKGPWTLSRRQFSETAGECTERSWKARLIHKTEPHGYSSETGTDDSVTCSRKRSSGIPVLLSGCIDSFFLLARKTHCSPTNLSAASVVIVVGPLMWIFRSFLVWTYGIALLIESIALGFGAVPWLILFVLYVSLLHQVTVRYSSKPSVLSALRCRLLLCSTVGIVVYGALFLVFNFVIAVGIVVVFWMQADNITSETTKAGFFAFFMKHVGQWQDSDQRLMEMPDFQKSLMTVAYDIMFASLDLTTVWLLPKGYFVMLISASNSNPVIRTARVHDVVAFALIGALGLSIGKEVLVCFSVALVNRSTSTVMNDRWMMFSGAEKIVALTTYLAGQLLVVTTVAQRRVLGIPAKMWHVALYVWAVYSVSYILPEIVRICFKPIAWKLNLRSFPYHVPSGLLSQVVVAFFFGKKCWRRYREAIQNDESKQAAIRNARILSSRV